MTRVIQVNICNAETGEEIHRSFTSAQSHREAVELALHRFSGGLAVLKSLDRYTDDTPTFTGPPACWRHRYHGIIAGDDVDPVDREFMAVLFSEHKYENYAQSQATKSHEQV